MNAKQLGNIIRYHRKKCGLTQAQLAKKLGFASHSIIAKYETGVHYISYSTLNEIAKILDVDPNVFFGSSELDKTTSILFAKCGLDKKDLSLLTQEDFEKIYFFISGLIAARK